MTKMWNICKQTAATALLLLFVAYYLDVNCFVHSHIVHGATIVHSHFHNQHHQDTDEGGHTATELTLIANMAAQFLTTGEMPQAEPAVFDTLILTLGYEQDSQTTSIHHSCPSLRAPPAC